MANEIGPNVLRLARQQARLAKERAERERIEEDAKWIDDSVPVFDRGNEPLLFLPDIFNDDEK